MVSTILMMYGSTIWVRKFNYFLLSYIIIKALQSWTWFPGDAVALVPGVRTDQAAIITLTNQLIVFGGYNSSVYYQDSLLYDGAPQGWIEYFF